MQAGVRWAAPEDARPVEGVEGDAVLGLTALPVGADVDGGDLNGEVIAGDEELIGDIGGAADEVALPLLTEVGGLAVGDEDTGKSPRGVVTGFRSSISMSSPLGKCLVTAWTFLTQGEAPMATAIRAVMPGSWMLKDLDRQGTSRMSFSISSEIQEGLLVKWMKAGSTVK